MISHLQIVMPWPRIEHQTPSMKGGHSRPLCHSTSHVIGWAYTRISVKNLLEQTLHFNKCKNVQSFSNITHNSIG